MLTLVKALLDITEWVLSQIMQQAARLAFYVLACFADYVIVIPRRSEHKETSL